MTYIAKPKFHHPALPKNALGYTHRDYEGSVSTLCAGCGHDSISGAIIQACFELALPPHRIAKLSGIGCSSKTPTYFLGQSHGFNSVHGRMPSVLTGANLANRDLLYLGVSGDGDSASIGLGQFAHSIRRGVNMVYIVENNGVYGLTKGQFSATADKGSKSKRGVINSDEPIDMVMLALQLGATLVARSFSGDKTQLIPIIKAAVQHPGEPAADPDRPRQRHRVQTETFAQLVGQFQRRSRKRAQNQYSPLVLPRRNELLRHQVHSVMQRCHQTHRCRAVKSSNLLVRMMFPQQQDWLPPAVLESHIDPVRFSRHFLQKLAITQNAGTTRRADLHKGKPPLKFRMNFQKSFDSAEPFQNSFRVVHSVNADAE